MYVSYCTDFAENALFSSFDVIYLQPYACTEQIQSLYLQDQPKNTYAKNPNPAVLCSGEKRE